MDISKESLSKIKDILREFKNKPYDYELIAWIITVLRHDEEFDNPIYTEKIKSNVPAYVLDGTLYISDHIFKYTHQVIKRYEPFPDFNKLDAYNYIVLEILFHELAHLSQLDIALKRKSKYDILNDLYFQVFFGGHRDQQHYEKHRTCYVHEYNANLEALRILKSLFHNNKFLEYLNNYQFEKTISQYYDKTDNIFIAEKTLDAKHIKDKSIISLHDDVPTEILISNGLPIDNKSLNKLNNISTKRIRRKYNL